MSVVTTISLWTPTKAELEKLVDNYIANEFNDAIGLCEHVRRNSDIELSVRYGSRLFRAVHNRYKTRSLLNKGIK